MKECGGSLPDLCLKSTVPVAILLTSTDQHLCALRAALHFCIPDQFERPDINSKEHRKESQGSHVRSCRIVTAWLCLEARLAGRAPPACVSRRPCPGPTARVRQRTSRHQRHGGLRSPAHRAVLQSVHRAPPSDKPLFIVKRLRWTSSMASAPTTAVGSTALCRMFGGQRSA